MMPRSDGHRYDLFSHAYACLRCGLLLSEWGSWRCGGARCGRLNRKRRKQSVRWWRDFSRLLLYLKPEEIRWEERLRILGAPSQIGLYMRLDSQRREEFKSYVPNWGADQ